jgi:quercetin dioxygenase-like cupin family protein
MSESGLREQAKVLSELINYQENAVVSRTLIDQHAGTITLFAFDAGQGLSEHTAPFDALVYVFDGWAEISVSGKGIVVESGTVTMLPAGKPHAVRAPVRFKMMLVMVRS